MSESMPPAPDRTTETTPTLRAVGVRMADSGSQFTREVGALLAFIGHEHEPPITCEDCNQEPGPCFAYDIAHGIAFSWLLEAVDDR